MKEILTDGIFPTPAPGVRKDLYEKAVMAFAKEWCNEDKPMYWFNGRIWTPGEIEVPQPGLPTLAEREKLSFEDRADLARVAGRNGRYGFELMEDLS